MQQNKQVQGSRFYPNKQNETKQDVFKIISFYNENHIGNTDDREKLTVPYAVDYWIKGGFPAHKIALGMGTYGRAFNLQSPARNGLAAPTPKWSSSAPKGQYTREGMLVILFEYVLILRNFF